jgi:phosphoglycolate phosphatase
MIKLVFFDWNGTILNDANANLEAENIVLPLFGIRPITIKCIQDNFEIPITKFYSRVGINEKQFFENQSKIQETWHNSYEKRVDHCRARAGAGALLKWLRSKGIRSVILSNHTIGSIERHLKRLELKKYFDAVLANDSIMYTGLKDKAKRAEDYILEKGFSPEQVLVVGDSPEEARIARRLNAKSALVSGGWYSEKRLREAKPDYIVERLDRLIGVMRGLGKGINTENRN